MKALALLSGGLDSTLAVRLVQEQGIDVVAVNFMSPFCLCGRGGCGAAGIAKQLQIPLKTISLGEARARQRHFELASERIRAELLYREGH